MLAIKHDKMIYVPSLIQEIKMEKISELEKGEISNVHVTEQNISHHTLVICIDVKGIIISDYSANDLKRPTLVAAVFFFPLSLSLLKKMYKISSH